MKTVSQPDPQISQPRSTPASDLHELIRRRAEEIYVRNGRVAGRDMENWAQAEQEILRESAQADNPQDGRRGHRGWRADIGEYNADLSGYTPGEFTKGVPVPVRFQGDKMFVKRPNGRRTGNDASSRNSADR